ncbi:Xylose isomerase-like TIM barrel [Polystyrenella longa]|uniref:Xylose isomerase-like TIM barrel n=1 Tax=Polystyrenella longa TaxID=2528007 RepID=A0A518CHU7_9PLAN|nr:sugar phosphate isomerase/epimerase family protein [Polystyrenella longa]QDU78803.1 Xylose isomerase-like TIM barrel [Polystyrenella longa]
MNSASPEMGRGWGRRSFLQSTLLGAGAALMGSPQISSAAEPVTRNGQSHFKISLAAYSFHRHLVRDWTPETQAKAEMTLDDVIKFAAEQNLDGVELTSYYFPKEVTNEYLMHLKQLTFRLGLDISGTAIGNDFGLVEGEARQEQLAYTRKWIDHAATMGAPVIRIFAGKTPKGDTDSAAIARCAAGINESLDYAAEKGVFLALENHGGITSTSPQMLSIISQVKDSPFFGVNFDGGNFRTAEPYTDLAAIAPYAVNAQLKVSLHPEGKPREQADYIRTLRILKEAGYRGYIVLEYEEKEDPRESIPAVLDELRAAMAEV